MTGKSIPPIENPEIAEIFNAYPNSVRPLMFRLRELIFETAATDPRIGPLEECLKWGEPSYLTTTSKSGSTIRIDAKAKDKGKCGLYFNCQTSLVDTFKNHYTEKLTFGGNRAVYVSADGEVPETQLRHCISLALTYHLDKKSKP